MRFFTAHSLLPPKTVSSEELAVSSFSPENLFACSSSRFFTAHSLLLTAYSRHQAGSNPFSDKSSFLLTITIKDKGKGIRSQSFLRQVIVPTDSEFRVIYVGSASQSFLRQVIVPTAKTTSHWCAATTWSQSFLRQVIVPT